MGQSLDLSGLSRVTNINTRGGGRRKAADILVTPQGKFKFSERAFNGLDLTNHTMAHHVHSTGLVVLQVLPEDSNDATMFKGREGISPKTNLPYEKTSTVTNNKMFETLKSLYPTVFENFDFDAEPELNENGKTKRKGTGIKFALDPVEGSDEYFVVVPWEKGQKSVFAQGVVDDEDEDEGDEDEDEDDDDDDDVSSDDDDDDDLDLDSL